MFGPEYGELINFCAFAIKLGLTTQQLKSMTAAYPTVTSRPRVDALSAHNLPRLGEAIAVFARDSAP